MILLNAQKRNDFLCSEKICKEFDLNRIVLPEEMTRIGKDVSDFFQCLSYYEVYRFSNTAGDIYLIVECKRCVL